MSTKTVSWIVVLLYGALMFSSGLLTGLADGGTDSRPCGDSICVTITYNGESMSCTSNDEGVDCHD